ncbi:MAG: NTP transferase domain-containing protein [Calditrichaeota bacterium]|nr:NTP transferase domain-containing protein [Calditrichota bacterium]MCB0304736.1 NTP transferase domain-containing protein [Calditrichota bacterium]MCB9088931.1 NTP transferase domain-containing protein [Calditrichia bacterium]
MTKIATVILAAGKGTRMKSDLPKVLHELNNRPMVSYVVEAAKAVGSEKNVLVVGHQKELVMETIRDEAVVFAVQSPQLGTGHAVMQAAPHLSDYEGDVLVLSGDVPLLQPATLKRLIDKHASEGALATLLTTRMEDPTGYGRIVRDKNGMVEQIVEEKDANEEVRRIDEINVGIYVFKAKTLFETLPQVTNNNRQGEYYLPDVVKIYVDRGEKVAPLLTEDVEETHGINTVEQLKHAEALLLERERQASPAS